MDSGNHADFYEYNSNKPFDYSNEGTAIAYHMSGTPTTPQFSPFSSKSIECRTVAIPETTT